MITDKEQNRTDVYFANSTRIRNFNRNETSVIIVNSPECTFNPTWYCDTSETILDIGLLKKLYHLIIKAKNKHQAIQTD